MAVKRAVLALNGKLQSTPSSYLRLINKQPQVIIGADGGAALLVEIGLMPDIIIGDFDSLGAEKALDFKKQGVTLLQYPVEKDETDGELALEYCGKEGIEEVQIIGATGGRFDQQLANVFLLEYALKKGITAYLQEPGLEMGLVTEKRSFTDRQGSGLSLLPLTGEVRGVTIKGCKYELREQDLYRSQTRGVSNQITSRRAEVTLKKGLLLYLLFKA